MQEVEYEELSWLIWTAQRAIKEVTRVRYLTIVQEESAVHFHLWFFPWTRSIMERYGEPSLAKIRAIMADQRKQAIGNEEWGKLDKSIEKIRTFMI
jgi:hypothetical protein